MVARKCSNPNTVVARAPGSLESARARRGENAPRSIQLLCGLIDSVVAIRKLPTFANYLRSAAVDVQVQVNRNAVVRLKGHSEESRSPSSGIRTQGLVARKCSNQPQYSCRARRGVWKAPARAGAKRGENAPRSIQLLCGAHRQCGRARAGEFGNARTRA